MLRIGLPVSRQMKKPIWLQFGGQLFNKLRLDQAPFIVTFLRPGVWEKHKNTFDGAIRYVFVDYLFRVLANQFQIFYVFANTYAHSHTARKVRTRNRIFSEAARRLDSLRQEAPIYICFGVRFRLYGSGLGVWGLGSGVCGRGSTPTTTLIFPNLRSFFI